MAVAIVGRQRLLDPGEVKVGEATGPADRLVEREALVGVGHDLVVWAERRAHRREATVVLGRARPADLDLRAHEALLARGDRVLDQRLLVDMQPAALGRVERPAIGGAARDDPEGQAATFAAKVPQRRVDRCERQRRDRAYGRCVGGEFKLAPDRFDPFRILADQPRSQMVGEEAHD